MAISARAHDDATLGPASDESTWQSALSKRRVPITLAAFTLLVLADMFLLGVRPRDIFDWRDAGTVLGELLLLSGLIVRSWAAGTLRKSQSLIRVGPYAMIRNPLYIGSLLMLCGFCTLVHDWLAMWLAVVPIIGLYWLQVRHEERKLSQWFPEDWSQYTATTPRFIPTRLPREAIQGWSLSQWLKNREYQALLWSGLALLGIAIWRSWPH